MKVATLLTNYADQFPVHGVCIFTDENWIAFAAHCREAHYPVEVPFGPNHYLIIDSFEQYQSWLTVRDIDEVGAQMLRDILGNRVGNVGFGLWIEPTW